MSVDSNLNHQTTLDKILLEKGSRKVLNTDAKQGYRAKSYYSNNRSSFGRSSHNKNERSNGTVCRTSTDMNTNFDSMIARYQTGQNTRFKDADPTPGERVNRSTTNTAGHYK